MISNLSILIPNQVTTNQSFAISIWRKFSWISDLLRIFNFQKPSASLSLPLFSLVNKELSVLDFYNLSTETQQVSQPYLRDNILSCLPASVKTNRILSLFRRIELLPTLVSDIKSQLDNILNAMNEYWILNTEYCTEYCTIL